MNDPLFLLDSDIDDTDSDPDVFNLVKQVVIIVVVLG